LLTAAGGVNVSYNAVDAGLAANNPALLQKPLHGQLATTFGGFIAGTKAYGLSGAFHAEKISTTFGGHIYYLDHGSLPYTDAAGNVLGQFRPVDYVLQVAAGRQYLERWTYGLTLKFIRSSYSIYRSTAIAGDIGVRYEDTSAGISISVLVKNVGGQVRTFAGEQEELPFDLQAGVTKRLANAPFGFSLTAQQLQTFDIVYHDTAFNRDNGFAGRQSTFSKIASHLVVAAHIYAGSQLEATIGYNVLRRQELSIGSEGNGLTGFSAGLRLRLPKLQVFYARAGYQRGVAANQIGITAQLDRLFGLGR
jgi:hypothetical protein